TSARRGRFPSVSDSSVSKAQGSRVSALFFAPLIWMSPFSALPPLIQMLSTSRGLAGVACRSRDAMNCRLTAGSTRPGRVVISYVDHHPSHLFQHLYDACLVRAPQVPAPASCDRCL